MERPDCTIKSGEVSGVQITLDRALTFENIPLKELDNHLCERKTRGLNVRMLSNAQQENLAPLQGVERYGLKVSVLLETLQLNSAVYIARQ